MEILIFLGISIALVVLVVKVPAAGYAALTTQISLSLLLVSGIIL